MLGPADAFFSRKTFNAKMLSDMRKSLKAPMLSKLLRSVVIDGSDNGAEAELKLHLRDDSPRQVAVQEERAAPPYDA